MTTPTTTVSTPSSIIERTVLATRRGINITRWSINTSDERSVARRGTTRVAFETYRNDRSGYEMDKSVSGEWTVALSEAEWAQLRKMIENEDASRFLSELMHYLSDGFTLSSAIDLSAIESAIDEAQMMREYAD